MYRVKLSIVLLLLTAFAAAACFRSGPGRFSVAESKRYEASLFRQHCAICHGPEGEGKVLADGQRVPSLREGEFKARSADQIRRQIAEGGNGMVAFRDQLSHHELELMTNFVFRDLRGQ